MSKENKFNIPARSISAKDGTSHIQHSLDEITSAKPILNTQIPENIIPFNRQKQEEDDDRPLSAYEEQGNISRR